MLQALNYYLGYGKNPQVTPETLAGLDPLEIESLVEELRLIDDQLRAARADSMASEVGDLKVNYEGHVQHLKAEGARLLATLSALLDVPIRFNKYTLQSAAQAHSTRYSIVSYW